MHSIAPNVLRPAARSVILSLVTALSLAGAQEAPQGLAPDPPAARSNVPSNGTVASQLTLQPGTFVTVRVNEWLSSDHNQAGDSFSATLVRPLVVDGIIVAQRGQTLGGRVTEAQKAGRVEGVSRLAIQLTNLTLVDGQQVAIQSQLLSQTGPKSVGRDVGAIAATTTLGAAVGAAAGRGAGAGIGAAVGAAAGTVGVLLTRGRPTVIYPESVFTFRIEAPVIISTDRAPQAFREVAPSDYERSDEAAGPPLAQRRRACWGYDCGCPPPPPPCYDYGCYGPLYYPYGYPFYMRPGLAFIYGPRFYYGRGFHHRGFRR